MNKLAPGNHSSVTTRRESQMPKMIEYIIYNGKNELYFNSKKVHRRFGMVYNKMQLENRFVLFGNIIDMIADTIEWELNQAGGASL